MDDDLTLPPGGVPADPAAWHRRHLDELRLLGAPPPAVPPPGAPRPPEPGPAPA